MASLGTILGIAGGVFTIGGYAIDQIQRKADAEEAAEKVYKKHHPEEFADDLEEGKNGVLKIVKF